MRRIKLVVAALVVMVAAFAAFAGPAMAQTISVGNAGSGFETLNGTGSGFNALNNLGSEFVALNSTLNGTLLGLNGFNTLNGIGGTGLIGVGGPVIL